MVIESNGWQLGEWMCWDKCSHIPKVSMRRECGVLCGNLLAQFKDQSAETRWLKLTAAWEMPDGAGKMHAQTYTCTEKHTFASCSSFAPTCKLSHTSVHKYRHILNYSLCDCECNICKCTAQCAWENMLNPPPSPPNHHYMYCSHKHTHTRAYKYLHRIGTTANCRWGSICPCL